MPAKPVPCPKCGRVLKPAGEVTVEHLGAAETLPVYQCDECLVKGRLFGLDTALTFCVDGDGRAFNPADPDGPLFTGN